MAVITPQTDLYLLKSPLSMNGHTFDFANKDAQANYFLSLPKTGATDFTYQRKDNIIRFPAPMESIIQYNYCIYRNDEFGNKWFYAFITGMEYINDSMTAVRISTDAFQTWQFDINLKRSYIDRCIEFNDTFGSNIIEEGLETGEYYIDDFKNFDWISDSDLMVCMLVSDFPSGKGELKYTSKPPDGEEFQLTGDCYGTFLNRTYSGLTPLIPTAVSGTDAEGVNKLIQAYNASGKADAIVSIFMLPWSVVDNEWKSAYFTSDAFSGDVLIRVPKPTALDDRTTYAHSFGSVSMTQRPQFGDTGTDNFTPRNKKLQTFPYSYLYVTNNAGAGAVYRWEDFQGGVARFNIYGALTEGLSTKLVPYNYRTYTSDTSGEPGWEYGLNGQKLPTCSWVTDTYTNWLTQNAVNVSTSVENVRRTVNAQNTNSLRSAIGGFLKDAFSDLGMIGTKTNQASANVLTGGLRSLVTGSTDLANTTNLNSAEIQNAIATANAAVESASIQPDQARGGVALGNVNFAAKKSGFTLYSMKCKPEYAHVIDDYFTAYGYKQGFFGNPATYAKRHQTWDYVKTIGCNITGDVPQDAISAIKNLFDEGLTIWHNTGAIYDYTKANGTK